MNSRQTAITFLTGLGVGVGLALLFAPRSGRETREWLAVTIDDEIKRLGKKGRRTIDHLQDVTSEGEEKVSSAIETGKDALENLSAKLD